MYIAIEHCLVFESIQSPYPYQISSFFLTDIPENECKAPLALNCERDRLDDVIAQVTDPFNGVLLIAPITS